MKSPGLLPNTILEFWLKILPPESPTTLINSNYYAMLFSDNLIDSYLLASARLIIDSAYP